MNLNNLKIGTRIGAALTLIVASLLAVIVVVLITQVYLSGAVRWYAHSYQVLGLSAKLQIDMLNIQTSTRGFVASGQERFLEHYATGRTDFAATLDRLKELTADNKAHQERLTALQRQADAFVKIAERLQQLRREVTAGQKQEAELYGAFGDGTDKLVMDEFRRIRGEFDNAEKVLLDERSTESETMQKMVQWVTLGGGSVAVVVALLAGVFISRSIVTPLRDAVRAARSVAAGDLTAEINVEGRDETSSLMQALKAMQASLVSVVANVRGNAEGVASASAQIAQGNQDLSQRTEQQASSLQQTAATMDQLGSTVRNTAENARQANHLAKQAADVAVDGGEVVGQVVGTMKGINDSAHRVAEIIAVIDSIAFQTNILALNAAVEAARAGEQGRGFAVVASEVRSLAQRSAVAAKEIKTLITASVEQVEHGTKLVDRAGQTMTEIVGAIQRVSDIVAEITSASFEQSTGVVQVGQAVSQIDQATQQNAALVEQSAAAAESLKQQAQHLVDAVAVFKLGSADSRVPQGVKS